MKNFKAELEPLGGLLGFQTKNPLLTSMDILQCLYCHSLGTGVFEQSLISFRSLEYSPAWCIMDLAVLN